MSRAVLQALWSLRGGRGHLSPTHAVRYRGDSRRGIAPLADIYLPARATGASTILVHGGAFMIGSRRMKPMRFLASRLVEAGVAVCSIDYRMIFRGGRLDEAVDDVRAALAFWRDHAPGHALDPNAISLVGLSAGGSLAMLAADSTLHRLVCCFGLYEMHDLQGRLSGLLPRLLFRTSDRATWRDRSPREMPQPTVPTLLLHGDNDGLVPVAQAHRIAAHRDSLGLPTKLVIYPGAPHGFFNFAAPAAEAAAHEIIEHVSW